MYLLNILYYNRILKQMNASKMLFKILFLIYLHDPRALATKEVANLLTCLKENLLQSITLITGISLTW